jgi:hypothetical protein
MSTTACPHCDAPVTDAEAEFCESCGKALPSLSDMGPRVVTKRDLAATRAGQVLQAKDLQKLTKRAANALLAVAILQAIFGTILLLIAAKQALEPIHFVAVYGIAVLFFGLYLWARRNPLPAAIAGLVIFVTIHTVDALVDPPAILRGVLVKIIIVVILANAISAGVQHRKLTQQTSEA